MVSFSRFLTSQRGGKLLVDTDGHIYSVRDNLKKKTVYICRRNARKKTVDALLRCPAKLIMFSEEDLTLQIPHNHLHVT